MRNIKFRGLDKSGKFVYGNLIQTKDLDGECSSWIQEKSFLGLGVLSTPTSNFTSVDSKTVGQFTDMYDEDDKPIYEGDMVVCMDDYDWGPQGGVVTFTDCGRWIVKDNGDTEDLCDFNPKVYDNIHQNEELLKGDK